MHFTREQRDSWTETTRDSPFNRWLRDRVSDRSGAMDLEALKAVAHEYGIDAGAYSHLNPGQQRMNIGNRLRKIVPASVYATDDVDTAPKSDDSRTPVTSHASPVVHTHAVTANLSEASNVELMQFYASVIDELRDRKIVRTGNAPLGDYAEHLCATAFGWTLANNSAAGYDATDGAGLRFQIKARRLRSNSPGERQLSVIRALPDARFDMLAAVLLDRRFRVFRAALIPHGVVLKRSTYVAHVNGWRLILDDSIWREPGVRDATLALAAVV